MTVFEVSFEKKSNNTVCGFQGTPERYSSIAQSVEHAAVNRAVVGSSPTRGVFTKVLIIYNMAQ